MGRGGSWWFFSATPVVLKKKYHTFIFPLYSLHARILFECSVMVEGLGPLAAVFSGLPVFPFPGAEGLRKLLFRWWSDCSTARAENVKKIARNLESQWFWTVLEPIPGHWSTQKFPKQYDFGVKMQLVGGTQPPLGLGLRAAGSGICAYL